MKSPDGGGKQSLVVLKRDQVVRTDNNHDVVPTGPVVLMEAECLSEEPLDSITSDGTTDTSGDG